MMHNVVGIRGDGHGRSDRKVEFGRGRGGMQRARLQQQTATFDRRVLDGISVAALLAAAVFFLWLIR
jgi:hypothetical protein